MPCHTRARPPCTFRFSKAVAFLLESFLFLVLSILSEFIVAITRANLPRIVSYVGTRVLSKLGKVSPVGFSWKLDATQSRGKKTCC